MLILQNFSLAQFLQPNFQTNLVEFVKGGGGLLFLGGPRALAPSDVSQSPLAEILPFDLAKNRKEVRDQKSGNSATQNKAASRSNTIDQDVLGSAASGSTGFFGAVSSLFGSADEDDGLAPVYDGSQEFEVEFAKPSEEKKALATVYDSWKGLDNQLEGWQGAKGLHRTDRIKLKPQVTPLLVARTKAGRWPLAVASYPKAGRALWLFSDTWWRLAGPASGAFTRQTYNRFMTSAVAWLAKDDLRRPLTITQFNVQQNTSERLLFAAELTGPAANYIEVSDPSAWQISVCDTVANGRDLRMQRLGGQLVRITGSLPMASLAARLVPGSSCRLRVGGNNDAFGSTSATKVAQLPHVFSDEELAPVSWRLGELQQITEATLATLGEEGDGRDFLKNVTGRSSESRTVAGRKRTADQRRNDGDSDSGHRKSWTPTYSSVEEWLASGSSGQGVALPPRFETELEPYWMLGTIWFWMLLTAMPVEVLLRKWNDLWP